MSSSFHNINTLREAAITLLREVESLASQQEPQPQRLALQEEVQRYESELFAMHYSARAGISDVRRNCWA